MFALRDQPLDPGSARTELLADRAGALVTFEGWVRDQNLGRDVRHLEYEGFAELAANEFAAIEAEALERFDILALRAEHRIGTLHIGDLAVWIGVTAVHRDPAFRACRHVIDELKQRLPIWKKEHYRDGDSGWIEHP